MTKSSIEIVFGNKHAVNEKIAVIYTDNTKKEIYDIIDMDYDSLKDELKNLYNYNL